MIFTIIDVINWRGERLANFRLSHLSFILIINMKYLYKKHPQNEVNPAGLTSKRCFFLYAISLLLNTV